MKDRWSTNIDAAAHYAAMDEPPADCAGPSWEDVMDMNRIAERGFQERNRRALEQESGPARLWD